MKSAQNNVERIATLLTLYLTGLNPSQIKLVEKSKKTAILWFEELTMLMIQMLVMTNNLTLLELRESKWGELNLIYSMLTTI